MDTFSEFVEVQICRIHAVSLIGFHGKSMDEERELFNRLNNRVDEIEAKKSTQYLVVSGKVPAPFIAVEVSETANVPEGMATFSIPEGEYVKFKFNKEHVGLFWANICTDENQAKYNIDLSKPRFELFTPDMPTDIVEWYIPIS
ncbi:effector binding domain-containing protein [Paenibacillus sp. GD4]|jgi:predicted transcriptional regulator YdeE|uniref:GyrI-like domain-containing protein n=1 Tax=Paenibacillus sp. GD4 TaxID=3068890 RepID=UPI002796D8FB|nr:effector binding domain-containing protein [Paenibacillus sp. GD4]MDQ1914336.1 effector binding domain-containing protein [Paenibacillus sp. GD4]